MELSSCKGKSLPSRPLVRRLLHLLSSSTGQGKKGTGGLGGGGGGRWRGHEIIGILSRRILCASSFNWLRDFSIPICTRLHAGKNVCTRGCICICVCTCMCVCVCVYVDVSLPSIMCIQCIIRIIYCYIYMQDAVKGVEKWWYDFFHRIPSQSFLGKCLTRI